MRQMTYFNQDYAGNYLHFAGIALTQGSGYPYWPIQTQIGAI